MFTVTRHLEVEGYFNVIRRNASTMEVIEETGFFRNLITNAGLNQIATGGPVRGIAVGTGNAPPLVTDTILQAQRARSTESTATTTPYSTASPYWSAFRVTYRFPEGGASGNLSEVGVLYQDQGASNPALLFSRSLIKDANGAPTTIQVLSNEILDVVYELRTYLNEADVVIPNVNIRGTLYTFTIRPSMAASGNFHGLANLGMSSGTLMGLIAFNGAMGSITGSPTGSQLGYTDWGVTAAYVHNSYTRAWAITFQLTQANGTHSAYSISFDGTYRPAYQMSISPPLVKTNSMTLTFTMQFTWARRP